MNKSNKLESITRKLADLIATTLLKLDIPIVFFIECLKYSVIKNIKSESKKVKDIAVTARTGFDRRMIPKYDTKPTAELLVRKVDQVYFRVLDACLKNNTNNIPKSGVGLSFESICYETIKHSITPVATFNELQRQGKLYKKNNSYFLASDNVLNKIGVNQLKSVNGLIDQVEKLTLNLV